MVTLLCRACNVADRVVRQCLVCFGADADGIRILDEIQERVFG